MAARSGTLRSLDFSRIGQVLTAAQRRVAFVGIWLATFAGISAAGGMGDEHPGQWVPFWQEACQEGHCTPGRTSSWRTARVSDGAAAL